jgi:hypothetical protein
MRGLNNYNTWVPLLNAIAQDCWIDNLHVLAVSYVYIVIESTLL